MVFYSIKFSDDHKGSCGFSEVSLSKKYLDRTVDGTKPLIYFHSTGTSLFG